MFVNKSTLIENFVETCLTSKFDRRIFVKQDNDEFHKLKLERIRVWHEISVYKEKT